MRVQPAVEVEILAAIESGTVIDSLLRDWPLADVAAVLNGHGMKVGDDGEIIRSQRNHDLLLELAAYSPSVTVRREAAATVARMQRLAEVLSDERYRHRDDRLLDAQIAALERWREWLENTRGNAIVEERKLKQRRKRRRQRAPRAVAA